MESKDVFSSWDKKWFGIFAEGNEQESSLPPFEAFVDRTWEPDDLDEIVAFLDRGETCICTTCFWDLQCHLCGKNLGDPSLQLTDDTNTFVWMGFVGHYVACHHLRPPDNMVRHIRQKIKEAKAKG